MTTTPEQARLLIIIMPMLPPRAAWPRSFEGRHWSHRSGIKARMVDDICMMVLAQGWTGASMEKAHITWTLRGPRGNFDGDNALAACKGWVDGLVRSGVVRNDTLARVSHTILWAKAKEESTQISIEEA